MQVHQGVDLHLEPRHRPGRAAVTGTLVTSTAARLTPDSAVSTRSGVGTRG
ncbi:hypothetical protein MAHJHV28_46140 [Mycobacterium avium subsp. hominissuis]